MKPLVLASCLASIVILTAILTQNLARRNSAFVEDNTGDVQNYSTFTETESGTQSTRQSATQSTYSSNYQQSTVNVSAANLNQPHILSINTSGNQLNGKITLNGRLIKQINNSRTKVNLSPFLSVGEHKVQISGRYAPASSSVNVELDGPGTSMTGQSSGSGILDYDLMLNVR